MLTEYGTVEITGEHLKIPVSGIQNWQELVQKNQKVRERHSFRYLWRKTAYKRQPRDGTPLEEKMFKNHLLLIILFYKSFVAISVCLY